MGPKTQRLLRSFTVPRWIALGYLIVLTLLAITYPFLGGKDPIAQDIPNMMLPIGSPEHLLGTDELGRDVLSRLLEGARVELLIAGSAASIAAILGTLMGLTGAYFGRFVEFLTMRIFADVLLTFPPVILALLFVSIYGPGTVSLIVIMGLLFSPVFARIAYAQTLSVMRAEYVEAARAFGAPRRAQMFGTILPNITGPLTAQFSLSMAAAILLGSGLSYLGLGVVAPAPSWGAMIASGQRYMSTNFALVAVPSLVVVITILTFSLMSETLRDWFDPRGRKSRRG